MSSNGTVSALPSPALSRSEDESTWSQWWLIPVLIVSVIALERLYSFCRRWYEQRRRGGSILDASQFSQLHSGGTGAGADEFDTQLDDTLEMETFRDDDSDDDDVKRPASHK